MKITTSILTLVLSSGMSQAAMTMLLGSSTDGFLTNLRSSTNSQSSTLVWGLVVDTDNNGFASAYRAGFSTTDTATLSNGQFLTNSSGDTTGDRLFISTFLMATGGSGDSSSGFHKPTSINLGFAADGATGVSNAGGQAVALIWFDYTSKPVTTTAGDKYGLYTLPFTTPAHAPGGTLSFASNFAGADPIRIANISLATIPEPSSALLGAVGALALLRRRRK